jgi:hypothetical protein
MDTRLEKNQILHNFWKKLFGSTSTFYTFGKGVAKYTFKKGITKSTFQKGIAKKTSDLAPPFQKVD